MSKKIIINLSNDELLKALGEYVARRRAPEHEGDMYVQSAFSVNTRTGEMTARVEVELLPDDKEPA